MYLGIFLLAAHPLLAAPAPTASQGLFLPTDLPDGLYSVRLDPTFARVIDAPQKLSSIPPLLTQSGDNIADASPPGPEAELKRRENDDPDFPYSGMIRCPSHPISKPSADRAQAALADWCGDGEGRDFPSGTLAWAVVEGTFAWACNVGNTPKCRAGQVNKTLGMVETICHAGLSGHELVFDWNVTFGRDVVGAAAQCEGLGRGQVA